MPNAPLSRRAILKGLGATLALPMLDAMSVSSALAEASPVGPIRMGYVFVPNGTIMEEYRLPKTGKISTMGKLPKTLEPLNAVKDKLTVITGLMHDKAKANGDGAGDHARSASTYLTGVQARKTSGKNIQTGISADQVAAQQIGKHTVLPSLEIGCEGGRLAGNCDSGYSCAYSNAVSWRTPNTPMAKETNPRAVFERLFGDAGKIEKQAARKKRLKYDKSILDFVQQDAKQLNKQLGRNDRRKMDEYLAAVRAIEQRIQISEKEDGREIKVDYKAPKGTPSNFAEHIRLMGDLMTLAFQTDQTRIATFMIANEGSNRSYRDAGVPEGHHSLSHHQRNARKMSQIQKINQYHMVGFAHMLNRMNAIKEGDGSLLDNSMIVYGGSISDGNRHNHEDLPIMVAGSAGGRIKTDRHFKVNRVPMTNLLLSMFDQVGVKADRLGDSTGRLKEL